ncbi:hypothetical protein FJZ18_03585 [Candidatus Pacearchaeota archaeon]|nr:hypothetical protein [Candidatus Pacearchaeota archaeon]
MAKSSAIFYTGIIGATICSYSLMSTLCSNAFNNRTLPQQFIQARQEMIDTHYLLRSSPKYSSEYPALVQRMTSVQSNYQATINKPEIRSALEIENERGIKLALTVGAQISLSTIFLGMAYLNARRDRLIQ